MSCCIEYLDKRPIEGNIMINEETITKSLKSVLDRNVKQTAMSEKFLKQLSDLRTALVNDQMALNCFGNCDWQCDKIAING